jgi:uncharacterized protein with HEPN domain
LSRGEESRSRDIVEAIDRIRTYLPTEGEPLLGATRDAVLYNLVVIGEAAAHLGDETRAGAPQIPWPKIVGLRNLLAHEYFRIDTEIVREIVQTQLTALEEAAQALLSPPQS